MMTDMFPLLPIVRELLGIHVSLLFSAFLSLFGISFVVQIDHALVLGWIFLNDVAIDRIEMVVVFLKLCNTPSMLQISLATAKIMPLSVEELQSGH